MKRKYSLNPVLISIPLTLLAAGALYVAVPLATWWYRAFEIYHPRMAAWLAETDVPGLLEFAGVAGMVAAAVFTVAALASLVRRPAGLRLARAGCVATYVFVLVGLFILAKWFVGVGSYPVGQNRTLMDTPTTFFRWSKLGLLPAVGILAVVIVVHVYTHRRAVLRHYGMPLPDGWAIGDRMVENARTHGADPYYRKSGLTSFTTHLMVLVIIPWLMTFWGCVTPWDAPYGSGSPAVMAPTQVRIQKKKIKKKYIFRSDAKMSFEVVDLDESDVLKEVKQATLLTYAANTHMVHGGAMGAGGGTKGGWPEGVPWGKFRFIRVKHDGAYWDDGMDPTTAADINFLAYLSKLVPFKVAKRGESHPIGWLPKYPPGRAPPFMYMTGESIRGISSRERKILREWCQGGGLLFADAGGPGFDRDFRALMKRVFPGKRLVVIADDDPLFQMPYILPHGAPPLWHHGGRRAMGIKHRGRWCVFYHPGDLNDAWKNGHSGLRRRTAEAAMNCGINVVYYAITQYLDMTRKERR